MNRRTSRHWLSDVEVNATDSEQQPLIQSYSIESHNEIKPNSTRWLAVILAITATFLQLSSIVLSGVVMSQYSYQAYMKERYPNSSVNSTGSQSPCERNTSTIEYKQQIEVQKLTSEWNIYSMLASYNIIGIIFTLNLATYSDVYGRKLLFIAPLLGTILKQTLCAIGIYFSFKIEWFILFYGIEGCTGSWVSMLSLVYSVIADTTQPGKPRSVVIGLLEGGIGVGTFITTTLSGYIIKWTDGFFYPEVVAAGVVLIGLLIVIFTLPETLHESKKRNEVSFVQNMARVTECYRSNFSPITGRWVFVILLCIFMMSAVGNLGRSSIETLYQLNAPFCWDSVQIGWYGAMRVAMISAGGLAMIKIFHCFTTDEYIALAGNVTSAASLIVFGFATTDLMLYIAVVVSAGSGITMAMVRSIMSRISPAHKQGSIFAGIAAAESVFSLASNLGCNAIYDATVGIYKGLAFFIMAGLGVVGIILCVILIACQPRNKRFAVEEENIIVPVSTERVKLGLNIGQNT